MFCGLITGLPGLGVGWAHSGVCSVGGRAQWPWRVLRTAGVAGGRVYFWARVRWVLGSSGVGAFCVRARLGSCCAGVFLLSLGPCCVARILGVPGFSVGRFLRAVVGCSGYGWADNSVGVGVCCVRRFLRTAGGPVAWPVLGTVGGCCGGVLRAVGPEGLLWSACSVGVWE